MLFEVNEHCSFQTVCRRHQICFCALLSGTTGVDGGWIRKIKAAVGTVSSQQLLHIWAPGGPAFLSRLDRAGEALVLLDPVGGCFYLNAAAHILHRTVSLHHRASMASDDQAPPGSIENPKKFLDQDFDAVLKECLKAGKLFSDPTFPAEQKSIGMPEDPNPGKAIKWKRPKVWPFMSLLMKVASESFFIFMFRW